MLWSRGAGMSSKTQSGQGNNWFPHYHHVIIVGVISMHPSYFPFLQSSLLRTFSIFARFTNCGRWIRILLNLLTESFDNVACILSTLLFHKNVIQREMWWRIVFCWKCLYCLDGKTFESGVSQKRFWDQERWLTCPRFFLDLKSSVLFCEATCELPWLVWVNFPIYNRLFLEKICTRISVWYCACILLSVVF